MVGRHLAGTTGHHNEGDGSEQAGKSADNDDDKHESPSDGMFGFRRHDRELGLLPAFVLNFSY